VSAGRRAQRVVSTTTLVMTDRGEDRRQGNDDVLPAVDVAGELDELGLARAPDVVVDVSLGEGWRGSSGFWPASIGLSPPLEQALEVEDQGRRDCGTGSPGSWPSSSRRPSPRPLDSLVLI